MNDNSHQGPGNWELVYDRPAFLRDCAMSFCPGCTHGTAHKLIAEVVDEMNISKSCIGVASVGCSVFSYEFFRCDFVGAPHGRAPAVATGIKRMLPQRIVFTYQGDGDLASIGMGEVVHAAARGEKITVVFVNNTIYGMTGGQMAPTTILGQRTVSSPLGRSSETSGFPIRVAELLGTLEGVAFSARRSLHDLKNIKMAKKAIRLAFESQRRGLGFSIIELLSTCPTNWGLSPSDACKRVGEELLDVYPIGDFKIHSELASIKV
ncbi:MAG: 2-oxoglutarate oxidoreductase [SAR324 cluster bacterium]|uniref:2-oxoglutarate oxidoreductase n=1 Tax=SAR324 cluster bacterium TaxID=2024889 RepID=A0A7X9IKM8_9DELT|nr:2-oxoglutarate oxidoreductase [SAR324 cluster bacterium]